MGDDEVRGSDPIGHGGPGRYSDPVRHSYPICHGGLVCHSLLTPRCGRADDSDLCRGQGRGARSGRADGRRADRLTVPLPAERRVWHRFERVPTGFGYLHRLAEHTLTRSIDVEPTVGDSLPDVGR